VTTNSPATRCRSCWKTRRRNPADERDTEAAGLAREATLKTFIIGTSALADIIVDQEGVAPRHAELVITDSGQLYLTDCASGLGTWRAAQANGTQADETSVSWLPVRQDFVGREDLIRLGRLRCRLGDLLESVSTGHGAQTRPRDLGDAETEQSQHKKGRVERDPITGQIVRKRV
jgi:hypothetical protein